MKPITRSFLIVLLLASVGRLQADVQMSTIFGSHMVLQQGVKIPVWGWAEAGEVVTVTLGAHHVQTTADATGKWRVDLERVAATSEPLVMTVTGKNTLTFKDVLVGDVWLCSGQSNMEYGLFNCVKRTDGAVEPQIRTFCVTKAAALTPLDKTEFVPTEIGLDTDFGHWQKENPVGPWGGFSAVGYFFGKEIHNFTQQPVGLIGSYWGGTPAQAWTSRTGLEQQPALTNYVNGLAKLTPEQRKKFPVNWADYVGAMKKWDKEAREPYDKQLRDWEAAAKKAQAAGQAEPPKPQLAYPRPANPGNVGLSTSLFNGMINPLIPYAIKGVIWYQGEANSYNGTEYGILFPALINDWRKQWGQGDFPFLFVQIANYGVPTADPTRGHWAWLREGQTKALALPQTGMAVAIDIGDPANIHPKNKIDVGHRLALAARHVAYGQAIVDSGPTYDSMKVEGNKIRITFKNVGAGLTPGTPPMTPAGKPVPWSTAGELTGFTITGLSTNWVAAKAVIDGASVVVSSAQVAAPVAVRYGWADNPELNLYNQEKLPAAPFRTDR